MKQNPVRSLVLTLFRLSVVCICGSQTMADSMADLSSDYVPSGGHHKGDSIQAAINTMYNLEVRKISTKNQPIPVQTVNIESNQIPLIIHFKSQSSKLKVMQSHQGGVGETQRSVSEDEPDILIHEVKKPIFQQVKEIIVPYRKTVQEIRPVKEEMMTIVGRANARGQYQQQENQHQPNFQQNEMTNMEPGQMMMANNRISYLKEMNKELTGQDENDIEGLPSEGKELRHAETTNVNHYVPPSTRQLLRRHMRNRMTLVNAPISTRGQLLAPGIQRRMLSAPFRNRQKPKLTKTPKRTWKILYFPHRY